MYGMNGMNRSVLAAFVAVGLLAVFATQPEILGAGEATGVAEVVGGQAMALACLSCGVGLILLVLGGLPAILAALMSTGGVLVAVGCAAACLAVID